MDPIYGNSYVDRQSQLFTHMIMSHFYKDTLDYFSVKLYPRFKYRLISTYNKAVQYMRDQQNIKQEINNPLKPAIILDPNLDLDLSDYLGKQFFRFPQFLNANSSLNRRMLCNIYQDSNIMLNLLHTRIKGEIKITTFLCSVYELIDFRIMLLNLFGGTGRYIYPMAFKSYFVLPSELSAYSYNNDVTNETYKIDLSQVGVKSQLIETINTNEFIYPIQLKPWFKLMSINDESSKSSTDDLEDFVLSATIEFELEIPTCLVLYKDYLATHTILNIGYESMFSDNEHVQIPQTINQFRVDADYKMQPGKDGYPVKDPDITVSETDNYNLIKTSIYKITKTDLLKGNVNINLEFNIDSNYGIIVTNSYKSLSPKIDYEVNYLESYISLDLKNYKENDIIQLFIYKK